jgi:uncharacterized protein (DUF983 family)
MITTLSGAIHAGLRCRCPRCGKGKLFAGFLKLRPRCEVCGLDYGFADSGDGPAVFVIFLAGAIVVGAALVTEILFQPPYWVHAVLWLPLILLVTLGPLRPMKGLTIAPSQSGRESVRSRTWPIDGREQGQDSDKEHQEP